MTDVLLKPAFQSAIPDSGDATKLGPTAWNAARLFSGGVNGDLAQRDSAASTGASWLSAGVQQIRQNAHAAMRALSVGLPSQPPALNVAPIVTMANAAPGSTPVQVLGWKTGALNPLFTFSGGPYIQASPGFPYTDSTTQMYLPNNTMGFGRAVVDFLSDAPALTTLHSRSNSTVTRVLVDGVEMFRCVNAVRAATAQAGAATTITLDASASATNGQYFNNWIHITGGTGVGQYRVITGYVGATKVATVGAAWAVNPDATSTFEITLTKAAYTNSTQTGWSNYFFTLDWAGERRLRRYRIEVDNYAFGGFFYVTSAIDSVLPIPKPTALHCFWVGDSFSAGTGSDSGLISSLARVCCDHLGWELHNLSIGATGYLNPGAGGTASFTAVQRLTPPVNAWVIRLSGATAGSYTLTQNALTTAAINYNDAVATIQSKLDTAFGSGAFTAVLGGAASALWLWLVGQGANGAFAGAMTANFTSLTGGTPIIAQYLGDLAPSVPLDGSGNPLPFAIVLANGHNDTTDTNAAYTTALLQSTLTTLIQVLTARYPQALIFVVGEMYLPGGSVPAATTAANTAIAAACTAVLPTINGAVPFIDTLTVPWMTGTGRAGALAGNGNSDVMCWTDGAHPTPEGHLLYGTRIARRIQELVGLS